MYDFFLSLSLRCDPIIFLSSLLSHLHPLRFLCPLNLLSCLIIVQHLPQLKLLHSQFALQRLPSLAFARYVYLDRLIQFLYRLELICSLGHEYSFEFANHLNKNVNQITQKL